MLLAVGNPMRGDDGVGPWLAERLQGKVSATIVDAGEVPENYVGVVAAEQPEIVVIVDAADFGAAAGGAAIIAPDDLAGPRFSTHNASLRLFLRFLQSEVPGEIVVVGVQPSQTGYGEPMSPAVVATVGMLQDLFERCWPPATRQD